MVRSIRADRTPHLLLLQYNPKWYIRNVLLVPRMFLTESVIEKRRPLSPAARRAGWVGCNILLRSIPSDGKIAIVSDGAPEPEQLVRREFERIKGLAELSPTLRGWTVDVLNSVRQLGKSEFSLNDVYAIEPQLRAAHPNNRNVRPKIRQQLQVLRNIGLIEFKGRGNYSLRE
jgi:type II restriction enzyme